MIDRKYRGNGFSSGERILGRPFERACALVRGKLASVWAIGFVSLGLAFSASPAGATVLIDIEESGSNVVATLSGTLDSMSGLTHITVNDPDFTPYIIPATGRIQFGGRTFPNANVDLYYLSPNSHAIGNFGTTNSVELADNAYTGDSFLFLGSSDAIFLPPGSYDASHQYSATDTWTGASLASLGLTPGRYVFSWTGSSIMVCVGNYDNCGAAASVPEPGPLPLMILATSGLVFGGFLRRRRGIRTEAVH